jgi:hypothetical protein
MVVHEEQAKEYEAELKDFPLAGFIAKDKKGGHESIKAAHRFFPEGEPILFMDDDFLEIFHYTKLINKGRTPLRNLADYIEDAFRTCTEQKVGLWGANFTNNFLYKNGSPFKEIKPAHICGGFFGAFNESLICTDQAHEDDRIRGSRYIERDGGTLIYNWWGSETPILGGGMQQDRVQSTKDLCEEARRTEPSYAKVCTEPYFLESEGYWTTRFRSKTQIRKILPLKEVRWSEFFQGNQDSSPKPSADVLEIFSV